MSQRRAATAPSVRQALREHGCIGDGRQRGIAGAYLYGYCRSERHQGGIRLAAVRDMERIGVCLRAARLPGEDSRFALIPAGAFFHHDDVVRALGRRHLVSRDDRVAARILKTVIASEAKQSSFFLCAARWIASSHCANASRLSQAMTANTL